MEHEALDRTQLRDLALDVQSFDGSFGSEERVGKLIALNLHRPFLHGDERLLPEVLLDEGPHFVGIGRQKDGDGFHHLRCAQPVFPKARGSCCSI
ncbi:hypothetical protein ACOJBO_37190 [Rhizobium beringeri]